MDNFAKSANGRKFFENDLPNLIEALYKLSSKIDESNKIEEKKLLIEQKRYINEKRNDNHTEK